MRARLDVHGARPTFGYFCREWVAPEVSEANWNRKGVVYCDPDGVTLFAIISSLRRGDELVWWVSRFAEGDRGLQRHSSQEHPSLDAALEALAAEVQRSRTERGQVCEAEWPKDREPPPLLPPELRARMTTLRRPPNLIH